MADLDEVLNMNLNSKTENINQQSQDENRIHVITLVMKLHKWIKQEIKIQI